jgi:AcrR family transcriptional regulator
MARDMNTVNISARCAWHNRLGTMDSPVATRESYHHGALAATMVEHALTMVRDHGADRVSLRSIAQALKVSPSATYNHFQDKDALLRAVGERGYALLGERMTRARASHPGDTDHAARARFTSLGRAYLSFAKDETHLFQLTFGPICAGRTPDPSRPGAYQMLHDTLDDLDRRRLLRPGIRAGLDMTIWAATHGMACLIVEGVIPPEATEAFLDSVSRLVLAGG